MVGRVPLFSSVKYEGNHSCTESENDRTVQCFKIILNGQLLFFSKAKLSPKGLARVLGKEQNIKDDQLNTYNYFFHCIVDKSQEVVSCANPNPNPKAVSARQKKPQKKHSIRRRIINLWLERRTKLYISIRGQPSEHPKPNSLPISKIECHDCQVENKTGSVLGLRISTDTFRSTSSQITLAALI